MLSVQEARQRLLTNFTPLESELAPLSQALGRVLAAPLTSPVDLPPFTNSAMDGFAVRSADLFGASQETPAWLQVIGDIPAGTFPNQTLQEGQALRIMTGAPLPAGADAVVPIEETNHYELASGTPLPGRVAIYQAVTPGVNVRPRGQDVQRGELVLQPGVVLRTQEIGFLSMLGYARAPVHRQPRVAVLSSGDELRPAGATLQPGKIYDANGPMLSRLVEQAGGQVIELGIVEDRFDAVEASLAQARQEDADLLISSAGVSVGAFDHVRAVIERSGTLEFWRVNIRPGKPFAFGHYSGMPVFGLPGNPVSAFIGYQVFVRPVLDFLVGRAVERPRLRARLEHAIDSDGRESYLRAVLTQSGQGWLARLTGHQGSGNLRSLVQANALIIIPSLVKSLPIGAEVDAWLLNE